jgi:hypothetical protein
MRIALALLVLALTLTGCENNVEKSARLRVSRLARLARGGHLAQTGLSVTHENPDIKILATAVLHDENGVAAVVTLSNNSSHPLREVPVAITLRSPSGQTLYQNNIAGLSAALTHVPLLMPGQRFNWIDDQIQATGIPGPLSALAGEAAVASGPQPTIDVAGVHLFEDPANGVGAEGTVINHSSVTQQELVVFAVGQRAGRIVAAGRAVLPRVAANSSTRFQVFFIGNPKGASLQLSAPATTLG